jgi:putative endonuclease
MYYVYVLQSEIDSGLYIGYTADLVSRLRVHNAGESQSTSSRYPLRLIYYEAYVLEEDAMGRERFLKSGSGRRYLDKQLHYYFLKSPRR